MSRKDEIFVSILLILFVSGIIYLVHDIINETNEQKVETVQLQNTVKQFKAEAGKDKG